MEAKWMKLFTQLGFLAVLIWVLAVALGRRNEATIKRQGPAAPRDLGKGDRWAPGMVVGEYAMKQDYNPVPVGPATRY